MILCIDSPTNSYWPRRTITLKLACKEGSKARVIWQMTLPHPSLYPPSLISPLHLACMPTSKWSFSAVRRSWSDHRYIVSFALYVSVTCLQFSESLSKNWMLWTEMCQIRTEFCRGQDFGLVCNMSPHYTQPDPDVLLPKRSKIFGGGPKRL